MLTFIWKLFRFTLHSVGLDVNYDGELHGCNSATTVSMVLVGWLPDVCQTVDVEYR